MLNKFIIVQGISAWEAKQLDEEIEENKWFILLPALDLLFSRRIKYKWEIVMKRLGISAFNQLVRYTGNS